VASLWPGWSPFAGMLAEGTGIHDPIWRRAALPGKFEAHVHPRPHSAGYDRVRPTAQTPAGHGRRRNR
ncbi:MAG TPA: hypothetical protein VJW23_09455, partial [Propionibacteriaceae bacterium]|nr:hypothetical protein [Propionibacteriaceae bacterium]